MHKLMTFVALICIITSCGFSNNNKLPENLSIAYSRGNVYEYISLENWTTADIKDKDNLIGVVVSNNEQAFIIKLRNEKLTEGQIEEFLKDINFDNKLSKDYLSKLREEIPTWEDQSMTGIDAMAIHGENLPTYEQAKLMITYKEQIDKIFNLIGGIPLGDKGYWTCSGDNNGHYYEILFWSSIPLFMGSQENTCLVR